MKQRIAALALCAAVCLSLGTPARAEDAPPPEEEGKSTVTWEELEERVRAGSATAAALSERVGSLEATDFDELEKDLRNGLNQLTRAQWLMSSVASSGYVGAGDAAGLTVQANQLAGQYETLRETYDDLVDGVLRQNTDDGVWQLNDGVNQVVAGSQSLYIAILGLEQSLEDGERGLATIDRSLTELRLRQELGQVSQDTVASLEQTRLSTASQLSSLENAITTYKGQLQVLLGEEATGELTLAPLPGDGEPAAGDGTGYDWANLDYAADLARAKENSWSLRDAEKTLEDAQEDWEDAQDEYKKKDYEYTVAQHTWNAAQATYTGAVQSFETAFKTLYDALGNYEQVWQAKKSAVTYQEKLYDTAQVKYERGMISRNALLSAQDDLDSARSEEESAWRDLFSARNSYRNAVERGLVSASN